MTFSPVRKPGPFADCWLRPFWLAPLRIGFGTETGWQGR